MRILLLTNMYPPHHYGGYEQVCRDVVERFRQAGHEVHVLTTTWRVPDVPDSPDDDGIHRELSFYWDDHRLLSPPLPERLRIERRNHRVLDRVFSTVQPDVVSVWNMGAMSLGLLTDLGRRTVPMLFGIVVLPITFLGAIYYPWTSLSPIAWLKYGVLINPLVYMSEGFRAALVRGVPHMSLVWVYLALIGFATVLTYLGIDGFKKRVIT